jgi:hypothetical protein
MKMEEKMNETTIKKPRVYPKIDEKHAAFAILVNNGVDKVVAAEALGYKGKTAYALQKRIEKKGERLDVANERLVRLSHRVIRNCLQGKPWGKIETIKDSTALAAAQVVVDRHQPKKQENSRPPFTFAKVDISQYLTKEPLSDATPIYRIPPPASRTSAPETGQPTYPAHGEPTSGDIAPITPDKSEDPCGE